MHASTKAQSKWMLHSILIKGMLKVLIINDALLTDP
jgi:hypothetical protein